MTKEKGSERLKSAKLELFCWVYAGYDNRDLFGNGTRCYLLVNHKDQIEKLHDEIAEWKQKDKAGKRKDGYSVEVERLEDEIKRIERNAKAYASDLIAKPYISERIDYLLGRLIADHSMDRELAFTAMQRYDLNSKVQAIREYNRLKDRGAAGRLEGNFTFSWEDDEPEKKAGKKKVVVKKGKIKSEGIVDWQ